MFTTATATTIAAYAAVAAAVAGTASAVVSGVSNYQQGKYAEAEARINQEQALQSQKQAYQEESLNATQHYRAGRHEIASGLNQMLAGGNVGTSTETAMREGYFNLAEDLSALRYKYGAEASKYGTQANMYGQHADMAKRNRRMGELASSLKVASSAARGATSVYGYGLLQDAGGSVAPKVSGYKGAVTNDGMYGAWAGK